MRRLILLLFGLVASLAGCVTGPLGSDAIVPAPAAAARAAERAGMTPGDIARAAELYPLKCAKCHKFYDPASYPDAEWRTWMTKMSKKSHLQPDETDLLARYLEAARRPVEPPIQQPKP
ncbi:MAG: hypothetical protein EBS84_19645 [Proteobacteria bacterium]|nr:hypothetical protein [Verrucomicrobiota bacterium]NBU11200.1 hypothetical protein [Pseudomonadota bacterium]